MRRKELMQFRLSSFVIAALALGAELYLNCIAELDFDTAFTTEDVIKNDKSFRDESGRLHFEGEITFHARRIKTEKYGWPLEAIVVKYEEPSQEFNLPLKPSYDVMDVNEVLWKKEFPSGVPGKTQVSTKMVTLNIGFSLFMFLVLLALVELAQRKWTDRRSRPVQNLPPAGNGVSERQNAPER